MTGTISGKKVLLTGASRGVGRACAELLVKEGAQVLGVARNAQRLSRVEEELSSVGPGKFDSLCLNVADTDAPRALHDHVAANYRGLDIAVFNAGVMLHHAGGILSEPETVLQDTFAINVWAPLALAKALLPLLLTANEPRIVNVGSGAGTIGLMKDEGIASYRLSKWTLHGLSMLQAQELAPQVSVLAFDPGWIKTDLGGPQAPGTPEEAALGLLKTLRLPFSETGKFYKDGHEIPW